MEPPLPSRAADIILAAFNAYQDEFTRITRRAGARFVSCDWRGVQVDALERLELYKKVVDRCVRLIDALLGLNLRDNALWAGMKAAYSRCIANRQDFELAETFFNSITRRIFATVGVDARIEFVDSDFDLPQPVQSAPYFAAYRLPNSDPDRLPDLIFAVLADHPIIAAPGLSAYEDPSRDSRLAAAQVDLQICQDCERRILRFEVLRPVFYRNFGAYLIGRIIVAGPAEGAVIADPDDLDPVSSVQSPGGAVESIIPLALCLRNDGHGVYLDAVLLDENEISIVFSFTRSYFHVDTQLPHELVAFLHTIMPLKRIAELYISIGYNKHGKTELYRHLLRHLSQSSDPFDIAPGEKGMVMTVFTLASYDMVFKIIKDRVDPPKTTSRAEVMEHYDLVFKHDKAGRLVDAQEFEHLTFERSRFSERLLDELAQAAPSSVEIGMHFVHIRHLYVERRLVPLNLYVLQYAPEKAAAAVIDYGQAIKDLAATDIFPGDVLLKNFGVTRHGRVVFYDYDELCRVVDCNFRRVPLPRSIDDEFESDPFFYVAPNDIFPEEFRTFLGLQEPLRSLFIEHHGDLFNADYWRSLQKRHRDGELVDILAYPVSRKLRA